MLGIGAFRASGEQVAEANVIFRLGGLRASGSSQNTESTQKYEELNVFAEFELLRRQSTRDLARHGGRLASPGWTLDCNVETCSMEGNCADGMFPSRRDVQPRPKALHVYNIACLPAKGLVKVSKS